ncbi:protein TAPETUM DETERMINANT 1 [Cicer arietinum]|uniref:Protein TAPETUM DETERMINANT 1-like n=1 Tax=Cicer arietinum TaxID=3827 RepID=A0A1S3E719_CICAR|nr:protein TAPETUM DETERMINANT 1-like [Cicer arietinum]XP_012571607.1 protein TAPETUM DETERMINANT 1-like [Cicer arietinum]
MEMYSFQRVAVIVTLTVFFFSLGFVALLKGFGGGARTETLVSLLGLEEGTTNFTLLSPHRKLLPRAKEIVEPNRIWGDDKCSKSDIVINQGPTPPLPSGIPTYTVEIMNMCVSGCDISAIHLRCGWFSSARLINPKLFKRLRYNDCLVNDGKPLISGATISFQYANTYPYPLSVSSVVCV